MWKSTIQIIFGVRMYSHFNEAPTFKLLQTYGLPEIIGTNLCFDVSGFQPVGVEPDSFFSILPQPEARTIKWSAKPYSEFFSHFQFCIPKLT